MSTVQSRIRHHYGAINEERATELTRRLGVLARERYGDLLGIGSTPTEMAGYVKHHRDLLDELVPLANIDELMALREHPEMAPVVNEILTQRGL